MTPTYLLHLSSLHSAAPGALDVIFGPDGDFEGAPRWKPPLWDGAWAHHLGSVPDPIDDLALDLRVPTVAARLAGLCAQALDAPSDAAIMVATGTTEQGFIALRCEGGLISERRWIWNRGTGAELSERPCGIRLPPRCDAASALAALTLALAPQIAVLGAARK